MSRFAPLSIAAFRRLAASYALNRLGDVVAMVALAVVVYDRTHSTLATTGLFVALELLPALAAPALTARLDRIPVARVLGAIYAIEFALFCALAALTHAFALAPMLALVALDGLLAVVARAITRGAVAAVLAQSGRLREGNALLQLVQAPSMILGATLGAALVALAGTDVALLADAASFAIAGALVAGARGLPRYDGEDEEAPEPWRQRLHATFAYLRRHRLACVLLAGQALALVFFAMTEPIEVAYTRHSLHAGAGGYGALIAAWGGGVIAGSALHAWLRGRRLGLTVVLSTLVQGAALLALALAGDIQAACAIAVAGGAANGVQLVSLTTALQERIESAFQVRVMSVFEALSTGAPGVGYLLGGGIAALVGERAAFAVAGLGVFAVVAVAAGAGRQRSNSGRRVARRNVHPIGDTRAGEV